MVSGGAERPVGGAAPQTGPEHAPAPTGQHTRRSLLRKLAYSTPAIVALSVGARQAAAQPQLPPGYGPPVSPYNSS